MTATTHPDFPLTAEPEIPQEDRILASVAHAATFLDGGLFVPFVLYLLKKDQSSFVAYHALQSLYFGLLLIAITLLTCGVGLAVLGLPYLIFEAVAAWKTFHGERYDLPVVAAWAKRSFPELDDNADLAPEPSTF